MMRYYFNKPLVVLGFVGLLLYLILAFYPVWTGTNSFKETLGYEQLISKQTASKAAINYVNTRDIMTSPTTFVYFNSHKNFSGYLQKENLQGAYSTQWIQQFPIDYYEVDVKDKSKNIHYDVLINMKNGAVLGWTKYAKEASPSSIAKSKASAIYYLKNNGYSLSHLQFIVAKQHTVPWNTNALASQTNNVTHFTELVLENTDIHIGASKLQYHIQVQGNKVTSFQPKFPVPSSFQTWFAHQNINAKRMTYVNFAITLAMAILAFIFTILYRKSIQFSRGAILTILFLLISVLYNVNMYPVARLAASGNVALSIFTDLFLMIVTLLMAIALYFSFVSGERMWRVDGYSIWPKWSETDFGQQVLNAMGRGYLLCLFIIGVQQVLFFIGEQQFQVWTVTDPQQSSDNLLWPALFPLMAWAAAISEEGLYRLFGIILFKRIVRNRFLSILLPSIIWAMIHTEYPVYPVYTRLVEVTVIGIILGYAFYRYGFITTLFAHATMDSILMAISLMLKGTLSMIALGILYMALPAIIGLSIAYLHHRFKKDHSPASFHPEVQ